MIVTLFKKAGIPREKATARTLRQFHRDWATRDKIHAEVPAQVKEIYESLFKGECAPSLATQGDVIVHPMSENLLTNNTNWIGEEMTECGFF